MSEKFASLKRLNVVIHAVFFVPFIVIILPTLLLTLNSWQASAYFKVTFHKFKKNEIE
ncbi:hypothetical protein [Lactobacillus crispatus]|jgi:hypothetical protein|uniref:hypothetical protein n=1 Tax=Lactobacillus crispatus TaxID=47770 RepID=UPI001689A5C8|nr:hypothetical protein [Lactobacillus crispatus]